MAPLSGLADQPDFEETGVLAALSVSCLDLDGGNDSGLDHDAASCPACPFGCFSDCALACSLASVDLSFWQTSDHGGDRSDRYLTFTLNTVKARSPPAA